MPHPGDALARLLRHPPDLPVVAVLDRITASAGPGAALVLTAPPGTGKTTLLPPALAVALAGTQGSVAAAGSATTPVTRTSPAPRVLVTQPRRVAVRAASRRIAALLHEPVGATVGYSVRGDSRTSPDTRIEMLTPGVLLRRLQRDPELPGVGAVVLDEFHERQLDTDLALALLLDVRAALREDLVLAVTSATLEAERTSALIGTATGTAPTLVDVPARLHPLGLRWAAPPRGGEPLGVSPATGAVIVRREFLGHVTRTIERTLGTTTGDVLVFLPGAREIDEVRRSLPSSGVEVLTLHGSLTPEEQDRVLSGPGPRRRVVLSTAVAESSLTVPGVRVVVDACLSREPRTDVARGVPMLVTVQASRARCEQRAGRAARLGPGTAVRCTSEVDWARRPQQSLPEIATADLTYALLQCAVWGNPGMAGLALLDEPPVGALSAAAERLRGLGAVDEGGHATPLGRTLAALPLDPPLARALVDAAPRIGPRRAARSVALLSEDTRAPGADLASLARVLSRGGGDAALRHRVEDQAGRLARLLRAGPGADTDPVAHTDPGGRTRLGARTEPGARTAGATGHSTAAPHRRPGDEDALALVVALAQPGWIARRRPGTDRYLLADGLGAALPPGSPLTGQEWLALAQVQRGAGRADGTIRAAVPIDQKDAERAGAALVHEETLAELRAGRVRARSVTSLGAIELKERALTHVPESIGTEVVADALRREGLDLLPWSEAARSLRERLAVLHEALGAPWPDVSAEALTEHLDRWLGADLRRLARGGALRGVDTLGGLRALLPWPEAAHFEELAPERLPIPTGGSRALDWSSGRPVLSLRVQEAFGWVDTPRVAAGRVPVVLHLLDPAGRPVAVTSDLASFWAGPYAQVRAQLRGRYPRHPWPEDPLGAEPTSRAKSRPRH